MPMARAVRMMRRAISPRVAMSSLVTVGRRVRPLLHPEDAEATAAADHVGVHRRQGDAKDGAGVAGVDDAVVVDLAGHEERVRLTGDLVLDGRPLLGVGLVVE